MSGAAATAVGDWLVQPWAGALLRFLCDPASELDPAAVQGWPPGIPFDALRASPPLRGRLGRTLFPAPAAAASLAACAEPRLRLALLPAEEALSLMARATAWIVAPRLAGLIGRGEIQAAQNLLGRPALAFGQRRAGLLPRPSEALAAALGAAPDQGPDRALDLRPGARLLGLALSGLPPAMRVRLRARDPAPLWAEVARAAEADGGDLPHAAFAAIRRLIREDAPAWSSWLN